MDIDDIKGKISAVMKNPEGKLVLPRGIDGNLERCFEGLNNSSACIKLLTEIVVADDKTKDDMIKE